MDRALGMLSLRCLWVGDGVEIGCVQTDRQAATLWGWGLKIGGWWGVASRLLWGPQAGVSIQRKERALDVERWP